MKNIKKEFDIIELVAKGLFVIFITAVIISGFLMPSYDKYTSTASEFYRNFFLTLYIFSILTVLYAGLLYVIRIINRKTDLLPKINSLAKANPPKEITIKIATLIILLTLSVQFSKYFGKFLDVLQTLLIIRPSTDEIIFHSMYLFYMSKFILLAALLWYSLYVKNKYKMTLVNGKSSRIKFALFLTILGTVICFFLGANTYIKIHKYDETITVSSGIIKPSYYTYPLDDLKVNGIKVKVGLKSNYKRNVKYFQLEFPNGQKIENVKYIRDLAAMLNKRLNGNLQIHQKIGSAAQEEIRNLFNLIDWATAILVPWLLYNYINRIRKRTPK